VRNFRMRAAYLQCVRKLRELSRRLAEDDAVSAEVLATTAYWLGRVLEEDLGEPAKARVYYGHVHENFPDSPHWADASIRWARMRAGEREYHKAAAGA